MSFTSKITHWYTINKRNLPWRSTTEPYYIWLSEIILQQTQVKQGLPYYLTFTEAFPTVFDLANATETKVLKLWQGLGYYSRARNLHFTAKYIVEELNGKFPDTYKGLLQLKGVGDYTASAIGSICFNLPTAVVDGNVYRALSRYYGISTPINSTQGIKEFKILAQELLDVKQPGDYNQAIMEFGARQCKPKNPDCKVCPVQDSCVALRDNKVDQLPVKLKKTKISKKYFNFIVFRFANKTTILQQREGKGIWQNLYQFPLIETSRSASYKNIKQKIKELNVVNGNDFELLLYNENEIIHKLSHQHLYTKFWIVNTYETLANGIKFNKVKDYPVPILIGKFIDKFNFEELF